MRPYSKGMFGNILRYMIVYLILRVKVHDEVSKDCMSGVMDQNAELWLKNVCVRLREEVL